MTKNTGALLFEYHTPSPKPGTDRLLRGEVAGSPLLAPAEACMGLGPLHPASRAGPPFRDHPGGKHTVGREAAVFASGSSAAHEEKQSKMRHTELTCLPSRCQGASLRDGQPCEPLPRVPELSAAGRPCRSCATRPVAPQSRCRPGETLLEGSLVPRHLLNVENTCLTMPLFYARETRKVQYSFHRRSLSVSEGF